MYEIDIYFLKKEFLEDMKTCNFLENYKVDRPYVGPILVGGFKYYIPLTSNMVKTEDGLWMKGLKRNMNIDPDKSVRIIGDDGEEYGVLNIHNMIPVPDNMVIKYYNDGEEFFNKKTAKLKEDLAQYLDKNGKVLYSKVNKPEVKKLIELIEQNTYKAKRARVQREFVNAYNDEKRNNPWVTTEIEMKAKINRENPWYHGKYFEIEKYVLDKEIEELRENKAPKDVVERVEKTKEHLIEKEAFLVYYNGNLEVDYENPVYNKDSVGKPIESVNTIENDIQKIARKGWLKW
ncbi:MAG: type III toxin-antitoxin system ToxN/AbiQ family toxin [Pseudobutyrivibrio sp.]|nr:type III toxin-antitoxin system ToxN/AbiQ family toxin [Pseudobutyrivibrio sp.]